MPVAAPSLTSRVADAGGELTPAERRVAEEVLADPNRLAFDTVAGLAERAGTSGPTVVRFAVKLGFEGFADLQAEVRRTVSDRLERATDRIRVEDPTSADGEVVRVAERNVVTSLERLTDGRLGEIVAPLLDPARRVWVLAGESSLPAAIVLAQGLGMTRPGVARLTGSAVGMAPTFADVGADDVVVVIDFPRYERRLVEVAGWLADDGLTLVGLTDGPLSPIAAMSAVWAEVDVTPIGPFDSALGPIAVCEAIVAQVALELRGVATERLDRVEDGWRRAGALLPPTGAR
ncbi:MAG: MurR/RpiR family transcriptional regulator [Actinomycetota bacterium]